MLKSTREQALIAVAFSLLLFVGWLTFSPGLSGPYFIDDQVHLPKLAGSGDGIQTREDVIRLILPDDGGSGRSLAYLSLLLDDNGWPASPQGFKRTNLLIHLLNGVLVFVFLRGLTRLICSESRYTPDGDWVALAGTALWLLHPLHLSPVMIVIQRMTLLGGTFSLLALVAYLHGRRIALECPTAAIFWLVPIFGACLMLGVMSKETTVMTVAYIAALELTVLGKDCPARPVWWQAWSAIFLVLPMVLLGLYLAAVFETMTNAYQARAFNLLERLMTESRVLIQYLHVILLPSLTESTPFRDDFTISRGLVSPPQTLAALATIALLFGLALHRRRTWPLFALAVLWFLLGHLLEGTVLPLEIYFEHRNYLPMLGPIFALCYILLAVPAAYRRLIGPGLATVIGLIGVITWSSARVWGSAESIALLWSKERPASARAQQTALNYWANRGDWERLRGQFDRATAAQPTNAYFPLFRFALERCTDPSRPSLGASIDEIERVLQTAALDYGSLAVIQWILDKDRSAICRITPQEMRRIFDLYLNNPKFTANAHAHRQLATLLSRWYKTQRDLDGTIRALDRSYAAAPSFTVALDQAFYLITAGLFEDAEHYVEIAAVTPPATLYDRLERDRKVAEYRDLLRERRASGTTKPTDPGSMVYP